MDKNKKLVGNINLNSFGYKIGYIFGIVVALCSAAVLIGITAKFLFWLF